MNRKPIRPGASSVAPSALSRRDALIRLAAAGAGVAVAGLAAGSLRDARAEGVQLAEDDPQAKALAYLHDASKVDSTRYPQHSSAEMVCGNCQLYSGDSDNAWGNCALFPGKQVNAGGWCAAYAARKG